MNPVAPRKTKKPSEVHALEPGTEEATVAALLWTSQKRCAVYPNPKRPTWRCKAAPTWLVRLKDGRGAAVCDDHRKTLIPESGIPEEKVK